MKHPSNEDDYVWVSKKDLWGAWWFGLVCGIFVTIACMN